MMTLEVGSSNRITLSGLVWTDDDEPVNDATVTMTLVDAAGEVVEDAEDLELAYVVGSDGTYRGTIPADVELSAETPYVLWVTAEADGSTRVVRVDCWAVHGSPGSSCGCA